MAQHKAATPEQITERHEIIRNMITAGMTQADVVNKVREDYAAWDISDRQVRNYVQAVFDAMSSDAGLVDRRAYFVRTLHRMDDVYSRAIQVGNLKVAHDSNMGIIKLLKLDTPTASMDWRTVAQEAGFEPSEAVRAMANLFGKGTTDELQQ